VHENLEFYGRVYGLEGKVLADRIGEVMGWTGLTDRSDQMAGNLSGGWKQRLAIANGILHKPKILFLDEPTAGIDPLSRRALWELLYELADQGIALFVTTHYMEEAERCNNLVIISRGKLLRSGKPADLKSQVHGKVIEVECFPLMKASKAFEKIPGVLGITAYGTTLHLNVAEGGDVIARLQETARREGIRMSAPKPASPSLEDVFTMIEVENHATD